MSLQYYIVPETKINEDISKVHERELPVVNHVTVKEQREKKKWREEEKKKGRNEERNGDKKKKKKGGGRKEKPWTSNESKNK